MIIYIVFKKTVISGSMNVFEVIKQRHNIDN